MKLKLKYSGYRHKCWIFCFAVFAFTVFPAVISSAQVVDPSNLLFEYLTLENGLPNNKVNAVTMDKDGFMWFGTNDGVCRYDGFNIKNYPLDQLSGNQARTPQISILKTDSRGNLLIGSYSLFRYDYISDKIVRCDTTEGEGPLGRVYAIEEGENGQIWIGSGKGLFTYDPVTDMITSYPYNNSSAFIILSILVDDGKLWLGTRNDGVLLFKINGKNFSKVEKFSLSKEIKNQVNCFYKDSKNTIWAGTQDNGIFKFSLKDSTLTHVFPDEERNLSNRIRKIINDRFGNIWVGSRLGIFLQKAGTDSLKQIKQPDPLTSKIRSNSIYDIFIDRNDIMWVGTFSFGVSYTDFKRKPFHRYSISDEKTFFSAKMINCFTDSDLENIWIGTEEDGLFLYNRRTLKFKQFKPDSKDKNSLAGANIKSIAREADGNLWIGYYAAGLDFLNTKTGKITHFKTDQNSHNSIASNSIGALALDDQENLFIGTDKGVDIRKNKSQTFQHLNLNKEVLNFFKDNKNQIWAGTSGNGIYLLKRDSMKFVKKYPEYFSSSIKAINVDSQSGLWVGTNKGLFYVDPRTDSLFYFGMNEGLPSNLILDILEDGKNNLWVSTGAGLIKCMSAVSDPHNFIIKQFNIHDGLQGVQFREYASYKNKNGDLYFGGNQGFNIFSPDSIKSNLSTPQLAFTQLKILNKNVEIGNKIMGKIVLEKAINQTKQLTLSYKQTPVSIEFAALHFSDPENNKYKFKLSPLEKEWNYTTGIRNFATYSNLSGGDYSLIVEAANNDGIWNSEPLVMNINVIPPFWKTWWFLCIMIFTLSASVLGYNYYRILLLRRYSSELEKKVDDRTRKLKESLDQILDKQIFIEEQSKILVQQKEQLQELNSTKDKLFSIIAHDLRSPFQALLGISEILLQETETSDKPDQKKYVHIIYDSSNHLFSLVENLLTWARTQTNKITFVPEKINVSAIIDNVVSLLKPNIIQKNITIEKQYKSEKPGYADKNMIEMVIRNLVSNAIKFTPDNGKITIFLKEIADGLQVEICDNGVGISITDQKRLFEIDSNITREGTNGEQGTGLGLIICKEFIEKNNGIIRVESKPGEGSSFFFTIPVV